MNGSFELTSRKELEIIGNIYENKEFKMQDCNIIKLWHTNRKEFINEFSIHQTINSDGSFEHTYFEFKNNKLERLSTCQIKELKCTGLKDKNGKLIYEGDIIRQRLSKAKFVIKYHNEYACFYEESKSFLGYFNDFTAEGLNSIEVIGNIYEYKEHKNDK